MSPKLRERLALAYNGLLGKKETRTLSSSVYVTNDTPMWRPQDYESFAREGYNSNPDVYACVYAIQSAVAGIDWQLFRKKADGERDEIKKAHPLKMLIERPNQFQGRAQFMSELVGYLMLSGNDYIERIGPAVQGLGTPRELFNLRPDRMEVIKGDRINRVRGYKYGGDTPLPKEAICHLKRFNPTDDWYGLSPIEPAMSAINQNNAADAWNFSLFANNCRPSGILNLADEVGEDAFKDLINRLKAAYQGTANAGLPMVTTGSMEWKQTSLSPTDMDFLNMSIRNTRRICAAYGVPSQLIGDETAKTYANYQEARQAFYQETILPLLDWIKDEFNNWLTPLFGADLELDYSSDDIEALQEDRSKLYERVLNALRSGATTLNEARKDLGKDDLGPEGDVYYVPQSTVPTAAADLLYTPPPPPQLQDAIADMKPQEGDNGQGQEQNPQQGAEPTQSGSRPQEGEPSEV